MSKGMFKDETVFLLLMSKTNDLLGKEQPNVIIRGGEGFDRRLEEEIKLYYGTDKVQVRFSEITSSYEHHISKFILIDIDIENNGSDTLYMIPVQINQCD